MLHLCSPKQRRTLSAGCFKSPIITVVMEVECTVPAEVCTVAPPNGNGADSV